MNEYLTEKEACELFKISRSTVIRMRKKGLPHIKFGHIIRYEKDKVKEWLDQNYSGK